LDILLYVVGKLDLAGPFAVKGSVILANCCKVLLFLLRPFIINKERKVALDV